MIAPLFLSTILAAAATATASSPSVVLITLDTTRADHLGCYGAAGAATPNLDALAKRGVRFEQAVSPAPLTLPAHASLLTGLVPRRHGVRDNAGFKLAPKTPLLAERLAAAGYSTAAFVSAAVLDREGGLDRGFATYDDNVRVGDRRAFDYQERAASQTVDAALIRLGQLKPPFFLWVHLYDPHLPYVPPEPYASRFKDRPYDGEIAFMDAQVGRLLDAVKRKATAAYVVVAGDHGESLGEHGEAAHGIFVYQATQRVPLIIAGPGVPAGTSAATTVGLIDVAPTIVDLLKLPTLRDADGRSLTPLLRGGKPKAPVYELESLYPELAYGWAPLRALYADTFKYIAAPRRELYDLTADPRETRDVIAARPARADELARALANLTHGESAVDPNAEVSAERREKLAALGYVSGAASPAGGTLDPKDGVKLLPELDAARRAVQLGNPEDALAPLARVISANPGNIPARLTLGQAQLALDRVDEAIATYDGVSKLAPNNALAWFDLGNAWARKAAQDPSAAATAFRSYERALSLSPRHADTYLNMAALQAALKDAAGARQTLMRARGAAVADPTIETELGLMEWARKNQDGAREAFAKAVALNPRQSEALVGLGQLAYAAKEFESAAKYYERALEARPDSATAKTLGAIRLYELNDRAGARAAFERALALSAPDDPDRGELQALIGELQS